MLHARDDLLPHEAALLEADAVKEIEAGLVREGVAIGVVLAAFGDRKRNAIGFVIGKAR